MNVQFFITKLYTKNSVKLLSILIICLPVKFTIRLIRSFENKRQGHIHLNSR